MEGNISYTNSIPVPTYEGFVEEELTQITLEAARDESYRRLERLVDTHLNWAKSSSDRQSFEMRMRDAQRFWLGKQWDGIESLNVSARSADRKRLKPCPVDNYYKSLIEGLVGDICDSPADIQLRPREPGDEDIANVMREVVQHCWYATKAEAKLEFLVRRGLLYGPLIGKVMWDAEIIGGKQYPYVGDISFIPISPDNFFLDPRVKGVGPDALNEAGFIIYAVKRPLSHVKARYPWVEKNVLPDTYADYVTTLGGQNDDDAMLLDPNDSSVLVVEYWYRGEPLAPEYPEYSDYVPFASERQNAAHVVTIAGGVLLQHRHYAAPKYPFALDWMYPSDESSYGYGDGYDMLMPQLVLNKLNEIAIEGHSVHAIGNWLTNEGNIRNIPQFQKFSATGGAILPVVDANSIRRDMGAGVSNSIFAQYNQEQRAMETVSGRVDITQGRSPRGIRAASAISLLLQQAAGRVRQRSRAVSRFVQQVVDLMLAFISQFYTDERLIRVVGAEGTVNWKTFDRGAIIRIVSYQDPNTGEWVYQEYIPSFDIVVSVGAETPTSKAYYAELATELFAKGVIDDVALLEVLDFPKWRQIKQRMSGGPAVPQPNEPNQPQTQPTTEQPQWNNLYEGDDSLMANVAPEQIQKLMEDLIAQRITVRDLPPEVLNALLKAVAAGAIDLKMFPPQVQQDIMGLLNQARQGQQGPVGPGKPMPGQQNPVQQQGVAMNGGTPSNQPMLRQLINGQQPPR